MERSLRLLFGATVLALSTSGARAESLIADPCAGSSGLLALIDRPTVADNPCAVPPRSVVVEGGVQWSAARSGGRTVNLPEAVVRVGLDGRNELVVLAPNFFRQAGSGADASGFGAATVGLKHELGYTERWLGAIEALATLPSGSAAYGSQHVGVAVNGIVSYAASDHVGLSLMLGVSSQTVASHRLCPNIPSEDKAHYVQPAVGHYGVFNGSRFRSEIAPRISDFVLSHNGGRGGGTRREPAKAAAH